MSHYALFIATNPEPVSDSEWATLEQVYDRARLSSGGTRVDVRSALDGHYDAEEYDRNIATFVNGIQIEVRDDGPGAFSFLGDGRLLGRATLTDGEWVLHTDPSIPSPDPSDLARVPEAGHTRAEAEEALEKFVEDWLE